MDEVFPGYYTCCFASGPAVQPDLTEAELDEIAEKADRFYQNLACG